MTFPDTTIEGKLFNLDTKFSFIRPVKRFEHSYYKLSLNGNLGEISECFKDTSLIQDVQKTINENLDDQETTWKDITIQVQIIHKPHSTILKVENFKNEIENKTIEDLEALSKDATNKYNELEVEYDKLDKKFKEEADKTTIVFTPNGHVYIYSPGYQAAKKEVDAAKGGLNTAFEEKCIAEEKYKLKQNINNNQTANTIFEGIKKESITAKNGVVKYRPNNRIWVIGFKVDFGDFLSSDNGAFKFKSFAVSFCYFGGEVSEDDQNSFKEKIDFIEGGDKSDGIILKTQAIIEQNKFLQNLVLENILKTKPEETKPEETKPEETKPEETKPEETKPEETKPKEAKPKEAKSEEAKSEEDQLKTSLINRITEKEKLLPIIDKDKIDIQNLNKKSFDELTYISFQIYEALKREHLKNYIISSCKELIPAQWDTLELSIKDVNKLEKIINENLKDKSYDYVIDFVKKTNIEIYKSEIISKWKTLSKEKKVSLNLVTKDVNELETISYENVKDKSNDELIDILSKMN